ncbi:MAG: SpvB/TcaC N-terminal domain-containing protein, partial [Bacteroidia bacterium]
MSNKSGTSPISSPKGGGAQSGLGEKFSPDLFTGTGNFSVPIALPPGRNGFQPELTLQYSTGSGNSVFGLGWGLSVPGVMRKTAQGVPVYDDEKDVFILSNTE